MYCAPKEYAHSHFQAYYGEYKAVVDIKTCELIEEELPKKQLRLVIAWAEIHKEELLADMNPEMLHEGSIPYYK